MTFKPCMILSTNGQTWRTPSFLGPFISYVFSPSLGCPIFYPIPLPHLMLLGSWLVEILIPQDQGGLLLVKWSKTIQNCRDTMTLPLPCLGSSPLCPIAALKLMKQMFPAEQNDPLFLLPRKRGLVPLTDSVARKHLKSVSLALGIAPPLTFHAFRRAGASWGVPLEYIKKHGTWKSDAVHTYLVSSPSLSSPVSQAFATSLSSWSTTSYLALRCFSIFKRLTTCRPLFISGLLTCGMALLHLV